MILFAHNYRFKKEKGEKRKNTHFLKKWNGPRQCDHAFIATRDVISRKLSVLALSPDLFFSFSVSIFFG